MIPFSPRQMTHFLYNKSHKEKFSLRIMAQGFHSEDIQVTRCFIRSMMNFPSKGASLHLFKT